MVQLGMRWTLKQSEVDSLAVGINCKERKIWKRMQGEIKMWVPIKKCERIIVDCSYVVLGSLKKGDQGSLHFSKKYRAHVIAWKDTLKIW